MILALDTPCTNILMRPSANLRIRIIIATVPTLYIVSGLGFSSVTSFCEARKIILFFANASSTAFTELSRLTNSGIII